MAISEMRRFDVGGCGDGAVALDIGSQFELVDDVVQVTQRLGLGREVLAPVPFLDEFLREGVGVG